MKNRKLVITLISVVCLFLIVGIKLVNSGSNKYEVIENKKVQTQVDLDSVLKVIQNVDYEKVNNIESNEKTAYVVVDCKDINTKKIDRLLEVSNSLGIKLTFIDTNKAIINNNNNIQQGGHTIIPQELDLKKILDKYGISSTSIKDGIDINTLKNKSIVIYITKIDNIHNNNIVLQEDVKKLEGSGYKFKAFA